MAKIYGTMENTLALHREMVVLHQGAWDYIYDLQGFGIKANDEFMDRANSLFRMSEKLRKALEADGIEVPDYDDIDKDEESKD